MPCCLTKGAPAAGKKQMFFAVFYAYHAGFFHRKRQNDQLIHTISQAL